MRHRLGFRLTMVIGLMAFAALAEDAKAQELTKAAKDAMAKGRAFLLSRQGKDGSWSRDGMNYRVAYTAMGVMALMPGGKPPVKAPDVDAWKRGKAFLLNHAKARKDGYLGNVMYEHGLATMALAKLWQTSTDKAADKDVQIALKAAVDLIIKAQNAGGGWRYQPTPNAGQDTSVTAMIAMALGAVVDAGIEIPADTVKKMIACFNAAYDSGTGGLCYTPFAKRPSIACSYGGLMGLLYFGEKDSKVAKAVMTYVRNLPNAQFQATGHYFYVHHYAARAMHKAGGKDALTYYRKIRDALVKKQNEDGSWGTRGKRDVRHTASAVLILETHSK